MADVKIQVGQTQDNPWQDTQYPFDGEWMPDVDAALIGPRNFTNIENLRYNDRSIEGVNGYTNVNATALTTYIKIRDGHQLRSDKTIKSYVCVAATDDSNPGRVYINTNTIGTTGDFLGIDAEPNENIDITGKPSAKINYIKDNAASLIPQFSSAPQNSIVYCSGEDTKIFSGYEHRLASVFMCTDQTGSGIIDSTEDVNNKLTSRTVTLAANLVANGDCEADSDWVQIDAGSTITRQDATVTPHSGSYIVKAVCTAADDGVKSATFSTTATQEYWLRFWVYSSQTTIRYSFYDGDGAIHGDGQQTATIVANQWNEVVYNVTSDHTDSSAYVEIAANAADTFYIDDVAFNKTGEYNELHIMTTRPVQGFKFYVGTANATASTLDVEYWNGSAFADVTNDDDDTSPASTTLATTGFYRFAHTGGNADGTATGGDYSSITVDSNHYADFRHFQELYLYAYRIRLSAGSASIYHITCDPGFQTVQNVWDGVYRQPIQFQVWDNSEGAFEDYTLHVNQSSDVNTPVGGQLDAVDENDHIVMMFEEQQSAIRLTMLGDLINTEASVITLYYWNGHEWASLANYGFIDGTLNDAGTKSFTKTGLLQWQPQTDEEKRTLFNSLGYAYKIEVSDALTGTDSGTAEVLVDFVVGVPALLNTAGLHESKPFNFSTIYQNRLMLGGFSAGGEGNRMDYSVTNAPDVFNGVESSMDGTQSLYFGGVEPITCSTQLYNRFGASVFSMLLVMKDTEVYLMVGESPLDFTIYPVSQTVGCPAPHTLATAEVGLEIGQGLTRNVAIWLSHYGPMMFDGAVLSPLTGINNFFDPNETEYIEWDYIHLARGWVDQTYKEYNLLLPSTSGQSTNNLWLVYDLLRKKWFKKDPRTASFPQAGWNVMDPNTGEQGVYGGIDDGTMIHIEKGTSWGATYADATAGTAITQKVRTGDFFPSNNIWDETRIRKFKLICKKIPSSISVSSHNLNINYYGDAANDAANVIFQDSNAASGIYVDFYDMDVNGDSVYETQWISAAAAVLDLSLSVGLDRVVRLIKDMNETGWAHSFEFEVATNDVSKGWQPIIWGVQYRVERKDNTSTESDT
jgi:hypothetical protein